MPSAYIAGVVSFEDLEATQSSSNCSGTIVMKYSQGIFHANTFSVDIAVDDTKLVFRKTHTCNDVHYEQIF